MNSHQSGRLNEAKRANRYRELIQTSKAGTWSRGEKTQDRPQDKPHILINGRSCLDLSSNDYLGLAGSERLMASAVKAMQEEGFGGRSSRLISGNNIYYGLLEKGLSEFKERDSALVFSSGYLANIGIITTLAQRGDTIFCDHNVHASIIDACRLSGAKLVRYPHNDIGALSDMLEAKRSTQKDYIVTEGLFSMDGDVGNLPATMDVATTHDAVVIIDDAHGTGTLGAGGGGAVEHLGLSTEQKRDPRLIEIGTLSKALGSLGGFALFSGGEVAGGAVITAASGVANFAPETNLPSGFKEYFVNFSRALTYTTALPPAVLAAAIEALRITRDEPERRAKLADNASRMREGLRSAGFRLVGDELKAEAKSPSESGKQALFPETSPIIPVLIGSDEKCILMSKKLLDRGIFIPGIRPPTVAPGKSRLRISVTAMHGACDIDMACEVLTTAAKELSIVGGQ